MLKLIAVVLALFIFSANTNAWSRYGGDISCGKLVLQSENKMFMWEARGWVFGYISGVNEMQEQTWKSPPDDQSIWLAVIDYCKESPLDYLYEATVSIYSEITERDAD